MLSASVNKHHLDRHSARIKNEMNTPVNNKSLILKSILLTSVIFISALIIVLFIQYEMCDRIFPLGCDDSQQDILRFTQSGQDFVHDIVAGRPADMTKWKWMVSF